MNSFRECTDATYENGTFQTNKIAKNIGLCLHSNTECKYPFYVIYYFVLHSTENLYLYANLEF